MSEDVGQERRMLQEPTGPDISRSVIFLLSFRNDGGGRGQRIIKVEPAERPGHNRKSLIAQHPMLLTRMAKPPSCEAWPTCGKPMCPPHLNANRFSQCDEMRE